MSEIFIGGVAHHALGRVKNLSRGVGKRYPHFFVAGRLDSGSVFSRVEEFKIFSGSGK